MAGLACIPSQLINCIRVQTPSKRKYPTLPVYMEDWCWWGVWGEWRESASHPTSVLVLVEWSRWTTTFHQTIRQSSPLHTAHFPDTIQPVFFSIMFDLSAVDLLSGFLLFSFPYNVPPHPYIRKQNRRKFETYSVFVFVFVFVLYLCFVYFDFKWIPFCCVHSTYCRLQL